VEGQELEVIPLANKGHMKILNDADSVQVIVDAIMKVSPQEQLAYY